MKLNPKTKISNDEMKNVNPEAMDKFFKEAMFNFKLRQNDVVYLTGQRNDKVKTVDLKNKEKNKNELF